ncbi:hypothetical protein [Krasilnikovia sp. MM14-A1259]|uniref:hypothetical protein n=1 Tax=Krasilnikovia sp. MM14-A1259 TaxID=3373539 RepID=UPI00399C7365
MDRHAATHRLRRLADAANVRMPRMHPHMLRHTFVTTMLDAGGQHPRCPDCRPSRRPTYNDALRPDPQEPRPAPRTTSAPPTWHPAHSDDADERMSTLPLWTRTTSGPSSSSPTEPDPSRATVRPFWLTG